MKSVALQLTLVVVVIFQINQCFGATKLSDFNKGKKFRLDKPQGSQQGYDRLRDGPEEEKCKEEEHCSTGDEFQMSSGLFGSFGTRDDVKFAYYVRGVVSYCDSSDWVLSGSFSGCWMTTRKMSSMYNGRRVGHVDTCTGKCEKYTREEIGGVEYFLPFDAGEGDMAKGLQIAKTGNPMYEIFGLVSPAGEFYTIYAFKPDPKKPQWTIIENPIKKEKQKLPKIKTDK